MGKGERKKKGKGPRKQKKRPPPRFKQGGDLGLFRSGDMQKQFEDGTLATELADPSSVKASAAGTRWAPLGVVLAVGNEMNEGTARGGASGFGLEVLSALMAVKSTRGDEMTLMHFVAEPVVAPCASSRRPRSAWGCLDRREQG